MALIDGRGQTIGGEPDELGIAPLVAALAPAAISLVGAGATALVKKISGSKPKPPPCTFWQRVGRVFGSKPNCS